MSGRRALVLTGNVGMGHHVVTEVVAGSLERLGWATDVLDCMSLLGRLNARVGDAVFRTMMAAPTLYDGVHFSHFRTGSRLARAMDGSATRRLVPAIAEHLRAAPADAVVSTFATGASAIAQLPGASDAPRPVTVALCTDVCVHSMWIREGLDLFLVTSPAAAASVRRHAPGANIAIVPPPVRPFFHRAPPKSDARDALGIAPDAPCVLVMGGGWGIGPMAQTAEALARRGVTVLAVAGHNRRQAEALAGVARRRPGVVPYGFTDQVPMLMAAADLVLTTPGATTCSEARVVGRPLMLLDVMPGHGRDNIQHELELGDADVCDRHPPRLVDCVIGALDRAPAERDRAPDTFTEELADALAIMGIPTEVARPPAGPDTDRASLQEPEEVH